MPNAEVAVVSEDTAVKQTTRTNDQGNWVVQFLIPARYDFTISAPGFKSVDHKGIVLQTSDSKQIDSQLEVGSTSTELTVTAEVPLIDTTAATSGTVISQDEILEMPSSSRVLTILATLSPGVYQQDQNNNTARLWSHDAAAQLEVNGGRNNVRSNNYELNGMPNLKKDGQVGFLPPPACSTICAWGGATKDHTLIAGANLDSPGWIAGNHGPRLHIPHHDGSGGHHRSPPHADARAEKSRGGNPGVRTDRDRPRHQGKVGVVVVVAGGADVAVLRNNRMGAQRNRRHGIAIHSVGQATVVSHGEVPRRPDSASRIGMGASAHARAEAPEYGPAPEMARRRGEAEQEPIRQVPRSPRQPVAPGQLHCVTTDEGFSPHPRTQS